MKRAKIFIVFSFILAFAVCVSSQTPKIVWKNLQEKYEKFEDIKPVIVNVSDQPIYFDCSYEYADQTEDVRLLRFDEKYNY
jgi:hypothetical protein